MGKKSIYIVLLFLLNISCEEVYTPDLEEGDNQLIIQALITNNAEANFVKVLKTTGFYEVTSDVYVEGASVELEGENGQIFLGTETSTGQFKVNHSALTGEKYKLKVNAEGETYESEFEVMLPAPLYDSLYVQSESTTSYKYSSSGKPTKTTTTGTHAYIDLPVLEELERYRFSCACTMELLIRVTQPREAEERLPDFYVWSKSEGRGAFNIRKPFDLGHEKSITKHSLAFGGNQLAYVFDTETLVDSVGGKSSAELVGWIVEMDQFGISEKTYNYYEAINQQLQATGKLFDAVHVQLESNITCVSNPDKNVVGFFELSSIRSYRFFMKSTAGIDWAMWHLVDNTIPIPARGYYESITPPDFWVNR